jgi:hypothetical protein
MTFHAAGEELDAQLAMGDPFFPGWGAGLVAMVLRDDGTTDWTEVRELLTESYCLLAPKKLIARLASTRPEAPEQLTALFPGGSDRNRTGVQGSAGARQRRR